MREQFLSIAPKRRTLLVPAELAAFPSNIVDAACDAAPPSFTCWPFRASQAVALKHDKSNSAIFPSTANAGCTLVGVPLGALSATTYLPSLCAPQVVVTPTSLRLLRRSPGLGADAERSSARRARAWWV